jgi:hypothetical protein
LTTLRLFTVWVIDGKVLKHVIATKFAFWVTGR